jgi:hypothetical protein
MEGKHNYEMASRSESFEAKKNPIAKKFLDATDHTEHSLVGRWIRSGRTDLTRVWRSKPTWTQTIPT